MTSLSLAAHKFHGPVGIGALLVKYPMALSPDLYGGSQQGALRPGTEPVMLAEGMAAALECFHQERQARPDRLRDLRDRFEAKLLEGWPDAVILGVDAPRLPHTSNIALVGLDRQALFMALDQAGIACSTGSACASGSSELSPVHIAMGCDHKIGSSALRFSLGVTTTSEEVDEAVDRILSVANAMC